MTVIVAPGTTSPCGSTTRPVIIPVVSWASTPAELAARNASASPTMPVRIVYSSSALVNLLASGNIHAGFDVVIGQHGAGRDGVPETCGVCRPDRRSQCGGTDRYSRATLILAGCVTLERLSSARPSHDTEWPQCARSASMNRYLAR